MEKSNNSFSQTLPSRQLEMTGQKSLLCITVQKTCSLNY